MSLLLSGFLFQRKLRLDPSYKPHQRSYANSKYSKWKEKASYNIRVWIKTTGCVIFIGLLLFMAGVELNPGPGYYLRSKRKKAATPDQIESKRSHDHGASGNETEADTNFKRMKFSKNADEQNERINQDFKEAGNTGRGQSSERDPLSSGCATTESSTIQPLEEQELVEFAEYISYEYQERIAVMLGFDLNKVDTLRCKHREHITGVTLDLLIDWLRCNPQKSNRCVSDLLILLKINRSSFH